MRSFRTIHTYFILIWVTTLIMMAMLQINFLQMQTFKHNNKQYINKVEGTVFHKQQLSAVFDSTFKSYRQKEQLKLQTGNTGRLPRCNVTHNANLKGFINLPRHITAADVKDEFVLSQLSPGGLYTPKDCASGAGTAVIVPYRGRDQQLDIFIYHLHTVLQRQRIKYGIFIVEMALPAQFNRGILANAGFITASSYGHYDCYIIHDVDLLPVNDRNLYRCGSGPRHLVVNSTKYINGLPYSFYVGGVLAMSGDQYVAINGFSNLFFGWGGEDDDIFLRIKNANFTLLRPPSNIGSYIALNHTNDLSNPPNPHRKALLRMWRYRNMIDGLNSVKHQRKALEFRPYYTWILIECVESLYFKNFPFVEADSHLMYKGEVESEKKFRNSSRSKGFTGNSKTKLQVIRQKKTQKSGSANRSIIISEQYPLNP